MIIRWFSTIFFTLAFTSSAFAADKGKVKADLSTQLEQTVVTHLNKHYAAMQKKGYQVDVKAKHFGPRFKLSPCTVPLQAETLNLKPEGGRISVKVFCNNQWKVFVPAQVSIKAPIAVTTRSIPARYKLQAQDIKLEFHDLNRVRRGYLTEVTPAIGKITKRSLSAESPLLTSHFLQTKMIKKGDNVQLQAKAGKLIVITAGTALGDGKLGQQIRIRNSQSLRVVKAEVIGPGKVKVRL